MIDGSGEPSPGKERAHMKNSLLKAIATDVHFWVPVAVLIVGLALLLVLR
jgi:hypothetical protein